MNDNKKNKAMIKECKTELDVKKYFTSDLSFNPLYIRSYAVDIFKLIINIEGENKKGETIYRYNIVFDDYIKIIDTFDERYLINKKKSYQGSSKTFISKIDNSIEVDKIIEDGNLKFYEDKKVLKMIKHYIITDSEQHIEVISESDPKIIDMM